MINIKLLSFDLDNTLAESKSNLNSSMRDILNRLIRKFKIAIITSGDIEQIKRYVLPEIDSENYKNLFLLPTSGAKFYIFRESEFFLLDEQKINEDEKREIIKALDEIISEFKIDELERYGDRVEDRSTQITLSVFGQEAPVHIKKEWDPLKIKRIEMRKKLIELIDNSKFEVFINGSTSLDISLKEIDKGYGMNKLLKHLELQPEEALFFGDSFGEEGNDLAVIKTKVRCFEVNNPMETLKLLHIVDIITG